jgi:hypothetical protein
MYYKSAYYGSDYYSSDYYNNSAGGIVLTSPTYYGKLGELGYVGCLPDRQAQYICTPGVFNGMNDCMSLHLSSLGYTGGVQEMIAQKSRAEGFTSPSQMWIVQGLIPL